MSEERKLAADLLRGTILSAPIPDSEGRVAWLFVNEVLPVLTQLGAAADLVEVYSPNRSTSCREIDGYHYVVFDHGLMQCMTLMESLLEIKASGQIVAIAIQKTMAEASRIAGRSDLYSFFVRRATEVGRAFTLPKVDPSGRVATAQALLMMLHECAHVLPEEHELRKSAWEYAVLKFSALSNQWIHMISAQLASALEFDLPNLPVEQLEEWIRFRDTMGVDDDQLGEAIAAVSADNRFRAEIACDRVAMVFQQLILERHRSSLADVEFLQLSEDVLTATYRAFLHLRLLKYIDDVYIHLPKHVLAEKINPLYLTSMVETGFRSTLVGQLVIDAAVEVGGHDHAKRIVDRIAKIGDDHRESLFRPLGSLLEKTILNARFHADLPNLLAEDGIVATSCGAMDIEVTFDADEVWLKLAQGQSETRVIRS